MTQQQSGTIRASDIEQLLLWAVRIGVMAVLIVPLVVTTSTYFPYVVGKAIYARVVIEITLALWLILILYYSDYRPSRSWILVAFGAWLLVTLVAGIYRSELHEKLLVNLRADAGHIRPCSLVRVRADRRFGISITEGLVCAVYGQPRHRGRSIGVGCGASLRRASR